MIMFAMTLEDINFQRFLKGKYILIGKLYHTNTDPMYYGYKYTFISNDIIKIGSLDDIINFDLIIDLVEGKDFEIIKPKLLTNNDDNI